MQWTIRQGGPADAPVIVEYNRRLAEETEGKTLNSALLAAGVAAALADPERKGPYFLAVEGGEVLGQLQITYEWSDWRNGWFWWIQSVYVRSQDRRRGVFRSLYRHVEELARRDAGVVGIRLYVERDNHSAQRTYRDLGMEQTAYLLLERNLA
jgi:ribosomal protein S18 acetylase RimI-like enzyme